MKFFLWKLYTFVFNLLFLLLDVMPLFIRHLVFCCLFGKISNINLIDYKCYFRYPHKISIGRHVSINRNCVFLASAHSNEKYDIVIGDNCVFAPHVKLLSAAHDYHFLDLPDTFGKIEIGSNAWLGAGCIVLPGKKIGDGAVVGAGSVVTKDIPSFEVWAGNPARKIANRQCENGIHL